MPRSEIVYEYGIADKCTPVVKKKFKADDIIKQYIINYFTSDLHIWL